MMKTILFNYARNLCVLLLALASFQTASATERHEIVYVDGFEYELIYDDDTMIGTASIRWRSWDNETGDYYQIQYGEWNPDSIYYVPSMIGVFPVTSIYGGFGGFSDLKHVVIPPTVTTIGRGAFAGSSIETITFDTDYSNVDPITFGGISEWDWDYPENGEFCNCERLKTVTFYRPINKFTSCMFLNCTQLENVCFHYSGNFNQNSLSVDSIEGFAFFNCASLKSFEIPRSVKVIGDGAFAYCTNLETINMPNGITSIGNHAFAECHQLQGISFFPSLQFIGKAAFINCWSLASISIPDAITTIHDYTFYDCRNLTSLNINNVTIFGDHSFAGCNKLTEIDLTKAQSIDEAAFFGGEVYCVINNSIYGEDSLYLRIGWRDEGWGTNETTLGSLKNITLGENVTFLADRTFVGHIPDTITCWAPAPPIFSRTDNLEWVFSTQAYGTTVLRVPQVLVNAYREAYCWNRFVNIQGMTVLGNGDVNGDGELTISDVTAFIDMLLTGQSGAANPINADLNGDGNLSIGDITKLIDRLLNGN